MKDHIVVFHNLKKEDTKFYCENNFSKKTNQLGRATLLAKIVAEKKAMDVAKAEAMPIEQAEKEFPFRPGNGAIQQMMQKRKSKRL